MSLISPKAKNVKQCPFCREFIAKDAVRCRYCHADLKTPIKKTKRPFWQSTFMLGFYAATLFWIIILIVIFLKF